MAGKMKDSQTKTIHRNNRKFKVTFSLSVSFVLIFMIGFVSLTYAWIFETDFSGIGGMNISLSESQGLVMTLDGNVTQSIDINSYLAGSFTTFDLKEASSSNGIDLFLRNEGMYYDDSAGIYDAIDVAEDNVGIIQFRDAIIADYNESFIYFDLKLLATGDNRYLIFDSDNCYIQDTDTNDVEPIRISLTFVEGETTVTHIFGNRQEYLGNYSTGAVSSIDGTTEVGYTTDQGVNAFADYNGYTSSVFDSDKTLYHLQEDTPTDLYIRIWLEGGDPLCTNTIAGSELNIELLFDNLSDAEVA